jgi:gluconokinase
MIVVLMGVCGSGKTTIGTRLAQSLGLPFVEGDDHHPAANRAKMASGTPLDDADRIPWLERLAGLIDQAHETGGGLVVACSALKDSYRRILAGRRARPLFLLLSAPREILRARLEARAGHFMPASLLDSQLQILEPLAGGVVLDAGLPPDAVLRLALAAVARAG